MMSVIEYANEMGISLEDILSLCDKLGIDVKDKDDMLDDDAIVSLDYAVEDFKNNSSVDVD